MAIHIHPLFPFFPNSIGRLGYIEEDVMVEEIPYISSAKLQGNVINQGWLL